MIHRPFLPLLRRLLQLCQNSLPWLLKLFSWLLRSTGTRCPSSKPKPPDKQPEVRNIVDIHYSRDNGAGVVPSAHVPQQNAVPLACSSVPSTPPKAHTRARSMDTVSSLARSPTIFSSSMSEYGCGYDTKDVCASPTRLDSIGEASYLDNGQQFSAEPVRMGVPVSPSEYGGKTMKPIPPSLRPRYSRNVVIPCKAYGWDVKPLGTYDLCRSLNVGEWQYFVHPDGQPYYLYKRHSPRFSYITEANVQDNTTRHEVTSFMNELNARVEKLDWSDVERPEHVEVVLEIQDDWQYYMVDMDKHVVFWIDDFSFDYCNGVDFGVGSLDHFRNQLNAEFWSHVDCFPAHQSLGPEFLSEVLGALSYWRIDVVTSAQSTCPYDKFDLDILADALKGLQTTTKDAQDHAYIVTSIARLLSMLWAERFFNFYGSDGARLASVQSIRGKDPKPQRTWLVTCLSPVLFYAPDTHLVGLERLWIDGTIAERRWKKFQLKLERDWESFVLYSTVLLNANVALLSTPIIYSNNGDNGVLYASPAAVASQLSIIASIASIIIGLLLIRQVRISSKDVEITASDAIDYLYKRKNKRLGLETMAIQYSLPYALLMWGMVTFLASIGIACFNKIDGWPNVISEILYAVAWLCVVPLTFWTVLTGWETNNHETWQKLVSAVAWKTFIKESWLEVYKGKPVPWRKRRSGKTDPESSGPDDSETTVGGAGPGIPLQEYGPPSPARNTPRWRYRVKNFGPVRRLTAMLV